MLEEKIKTLDLKPFPYDLKFIVTSSVMESERKLRAKLKDHSPAKSNARTGAMAMYDRNLTTMYIIMPYKCDVGYIAHESWHIVRALLTYVNATLDNEVVAYYLGWITREATRFNFKVTKDREKKAESVAIDSTELRVVQ